MKRWKENQEFGTAVRDETQITYKKGGGKKTAKKRDGKENSVMVGGKVSEKSAKNVTVTKKAWW